MKTFLFYDIETSGLSSAFDQVLTFAAIRTDKALNEIDRYSVTVSLRPDIVPSPGAFITHRLTMDELESGLCEYEAMTVIHGIVNTPGTISIGYNTLGFDDEFLRFAFYRNLLDPYSHQYANGCSRMDLLPIATLYRIFKPDLVRWPERDGKPSMKLELISQENSLVQSGRAHDAMTDVEATLELARRLAVEASMWNYSLDFFDKRKDQARVEAIDDRFQSVFGRHRVCIMVSVSFGADLMFMAPVVSLGHSAAYSNQSLWLRLDNAEVLPFEPDSGNGPFVIRKRYGEAKIVLPPLDRFWGRLTLEQRNRCEGNLALIQGDPDAFQKLVLHHRDFKYPFVPDLDLDASLYQAGFFSKRDKADMGVFHQASNDGKMGVCSRMSSARVQALAQRVVVRNFPDQATPQALAEHGEYLDRLRSSASADPVHGYRNDVKLACDSAREEIDAIKAKGGLDGEQEAILEWLAAYLTTL
ncbi:MAG: exodeoxyribonuclease I [Desulfobacteraceae bacterium]|nr:exodeoxyribonuclease I [Desulfobacteraceae bacterium]